jgi:hypothetical protein
MRSEIFPIAALAFLVACSSRTHNLAQSERDGALLRDSGADDAGAAEAGPHFDDDASPQLCNGRTCACSNGLDDDGDKLTDGEDPECTGNADDLENSFATRSDDDRENAKCQDCYFNTVPGNDVCNRPSSCATDGTPSGGTGACRECAVGNACVSACAALAPNGCDCFGCCEVWNKGQKLRILLRASCSMDTLADAVACPRCEQATDCLNECSTCERCPGKTLNDLPSSCSAPPQFQCNEGKTCTKDPDCGPARYCSQNCCVSFAIGF